MLSKIVCYLNNHKILARHCNLYHHYIIKNTFVNNINKNAKKRHYPKYEGRQIVPCSEGTSAFFFENQYGKGIKQKFAHWTFAAHRDIMRVVNGKCPIRATTLRR
jgi:hypothetical protein